LNPRPKEEFIYKAYASYYTHGDGATTIIKKIKEKLRNECYSHWLNTNIEPRFNIPKSCFSFLSVFKNKVQIPFGLNQLVTLQKGRLLDVGCGNGRMLQIAHQLGWEVVGLEIDPEAVREAKSKGLEVHEGNLDKISSLGKFDCVLCSHVIEHVYKPKILIKKLKESVRRGGTLMVSCPNATSSLRLEFKKFWRGLEAPRHISIPSKKTFRETMGFVSGDIQKNIFENSFEGSLKIAKNNIRNDKKISKKIVLTDDFIGLIAYYKNII
jgi:2-polyprenyl-3-methyl-5-hydroxy-6-metoxy-1,4-benzoquinol methylase